MATCEIKPDQESIWGVLQNPSVEATEQAADFLGGPKKSFYRLAQEVLGQTGKPFRATQPEMKIANEPISGYVDALTTGEVSLTINGIEIIVELTDRIIGTRTTNHEGRVSYGVTRSGYTIWGALCPLDQNQPPRPFLSHLFKIKSDGSITHGVWGQEPASQAERVTLYHILQGLKQTAPPTLRILRQ